MLWPPSLLSIQLLPHETCYKRSAQTITMPETYNQSLPKGPQLYISFNFRFEYLYKIDLYFDLI
ncbi:hypothetical protein Hanom_Chr04g00368191 [Helianthus anomalus]